MAEDQGVDGDRWNDQATVLLEKLNWESLGDSNIDIPNDKNSNHGVDRLFKYIESRKSSIEQGVIVEAKSYKTTSFNPNLLENWIKTLDNKLSNIKNSGAFYDKFPTMSTVPLKTGVIVIWFHDTVPYIDFKNKFWESARKVKLTRKNATSNKIYVLENDAILKLASLVTSIDQINADTNNKTKVQFYYPSIDSNSARRSQVLNLNYMVSKFILADFTDSKGIENKVVFFFGKLTYESFLRLKNALSIYGYLDADKPLFIYTYFRDDQQFRKIEPEIKKLFQEINFTRKEMENMIDLPTFMRK